MGVDGPETPPAPAVAPKRAGGDYLSILSGTTQNVVGIVAAALATFAAQVVLSRRLGTDGFGVVTVMTQAAFVLSFATRAGMDMAVLRDVAIQIGAGRRDRVRSLVARAVVIAGVVSALVACAAFAGADAIRSMFNFTGADADWVVQTAAIGLPFLALANVWLSATRGLKIMRYTLYIFWAGQPVVWVLLMLAGLPVVESAWMGVLAYSLSWLWASVAAWWSWRRESRTWATEPLAKGDLGRLMRYAGPRAPAALFSQLLFWTDLFVLTRFASQESVGIYAAALRAGQVMMLFLTSVSLMFSPFVADLHSRGESERLDRLFKALTRWILAATIPGFLVLAVAPDSVLRIFGSDFAGGQAALLILLAGQLVNVATGSVGFVLIMVGRTGWDLTVYAGSLMLNLGLAFWLCPRFGMEGAAIANAVTFALSKWARLELVRRFVHIWPYDRAYARILGPAAVCLVVTWAVHALVGGGWVVNLVATAALGFAAYGVAYLLIGLTPAERRGLAELRGRVPLLSRGRAESSQAP